MFLNSSCSSVGVADALGVGEGDGDGVWARVENEIEIRTANTLIPKRSANRLVALMVLLLLPIPEMKPICLSLKHSHRHQTPD